MQEQDGPAMAMSRGMPSALEPGGNGLAVERVWHVFGAQPALAGYADAIGEVVEATGAVGIGVDGDLHAVVAGFFDVALGYGQFHGVFDGQLSLAHIPFGSLQLF